jgi:hypothetical protein
LAQVLPGLLHHPLVHSTHVFGETGTALPGCSDSSCHMQDIAVELRAGPNIAHACCVFIVASLLVFAALYGEHSEWQSQWMSPERAE